MFLICQRIRSHSPSSENCHSEGATKWRPKNLKREILPLHFVQGQNDINPEYGFTLLEVLAAIILLSVSVIAICWAFSTGIFSASGAEDADLALNIAQAKLEQLRNTAFASLADSGPAADAIFPNFNVTVNVAEGQNPMQVDVTVAWNVKGGSTNIVLTTLIADYSTT